MAVVLVTSAAAGYSACTGGSPTGPRKTTLITITPDSTSISVGATVALSATDHATASSSPAFFWSSSDTTIAVVSQSGVVTARNAGTVHVAASEQGRSGVATVVVLQQAIGSVVVAPNTVTLRMNTTVQLADTVKDSNGGVLPGRTVTWASDNAAVVTVDAAGLVVAHAIGVAHVTASAGGQSGSATVTVTSVPVARLTITPAHPIVFVNQTTQLTAQPMDSAGNPLAGRVVSWQTANPGAASVSSSGLVTGVAVGTALIQASSEGKTATDTVTVSPAPVSAVVLSPNTSSLFVGQTEQLTARVTDANGVPIPGAVVTFSSTNLGVATVDPSSGLVTAVAPGIAAIVGSSGGKTGQAAVAVLQVPVASVTVAPPVDTLTVGHQVTLQATVLDSAGHPLSGRQISWRSHDPAIATVTDAGVVTAITPGTTVIVASAGGKSGDATITVNPVPVGSVAVSPKTATLDQGQQRPFSVTVRDQNGTVVTDRPVIWTSSDNTVATINGAGLVSALNIGSASIVAQAGGKADTAAVTVVAVPVATVTVAPFDTTITTEETAQMRVTVVDSLGHTVPSPVVIWASDPPGRVDPASGLVTPQSGDEGNPIAITATSGGVMGRATVNVVGKH